jgi:hypothetical protein
MKRRTSSPWVLVVLMVSLKGATGAEEQVLSAQREDAAKAVEQAVEENETLYRRFVQEMSGVKLSGQFTVLGKEPSDPSQEEYTITSVKKLPLGDYWLFKARIRYGKTDVPLPVPLEVKWAGDTPVITLTELTIPGLGTFSSRVVIHDGKYAGTWKHGSAQGHMLGVITKAEDEPRKEGQ